MAKLKALLLLSVACIVSVSGQEVPPRDIPIGPTYVPKTNTTTTPDIPITTPSVKPTPPTSTSTSTTSTSKPTTTTTKTTTTITTTPTTTTTKPTTSTTPTPTSTPKPTPVPDPAQGHWTANYTASNRSCIVLNAAIQITIPYKKDNVTSLYKVNVPPEAKSRGSCGNSTQQEINLQFDPALNNVTLYFTKKINDTSRYELNTILVEVNVTLPNAAGPAIYRFNHTRDEFVTPITRSYRCAQEQALNLTAAELNATATLLLSHLQFQAYRNATNTNFDNALDCISGETPDAVPIAVGCALAALVIIVLIGYLIGRRRSQARGYLSMFVENKREEEYIPMKNLSCFS